MATEFEIVRDHLHYIERSQRRLVTLALVAMLLAVGAIAWHFLAPAEAQRVRWEYRIEFFLEGAVATGLNTAGESGWEVVDVRRARTGSGESGEWGSEVVFRRRR